MPPVDEALSVYRELALRADLGPLLTLSIGLAALLVALFFVYRLVSEIFVELPYRVRHGYGGAAVWATVSLVLLAAGLTFFAFALLSVLGRPRPDWLVWQVSVDFAEQAGQALLQSSGQRWLDALVAGWLCLGAGAHATAELVKSLADRPRKRAEARRAAMLLDKLGAEDVPEKKTARSVVRYR